MLIIFQSKCEAFVVISMKESCYITLQYCSVLSLSSCALLDDRAWRSIGARCTCVLAL